MKKILIILCVIFLIGCTQVDAESVNAEVSDYERYSDHEQLIEDLLERIGELEEEVGNLKEDLEKEDLENGLFE